MEGGVDMDERVESPPNTERQEPVAEEDQEEGNKFQKAIGAWRSANAGHGCMGPG
jgi:homeobox protein cut-like